MLGVGAKKKTYMDDVFSTYLWEGNATTRDINNGIDLAGEGGLVWIKNRENGNQNNLLFDTTAPPQSSGNLYSYPLQSNANVARGPSVNGFKSFNSNGFSVYTDSGVNQNDKGIASFTFRKAPGFFDCVEFSGNGSSYRAIAHNLGCVPGMLMVKRTDTTGDWQVLHRKHYGTTSKYSSLKLNSNAAAYDSWSEFNRTNPTATHFTVSNDPSVNATGGTYICYLFAGGESNASEARSVEFDNSGDLLYLGASNDFHFTGDFTIEGWFYSNGHSSYDALCGLGEYNTTGGFEMYYSSNGKVLCAHDGSGNVQSTTPIGIKQWTHIALVRSGSAVSIYVNGVKEDTETISGDFGSNTNKDFRIGAAYKNDGSTVDYFDGKISNFRIVKGTAVYTSSFKPPTEPLTNISGTVLLCCNNSSTTGKTTGGTITATGDPAASTDSPFNDPAGFVFGDAEDQNVIKCGSYKGATAAVSVNLGWEPSWVMVKRSNSTGGWRMYDNMRGLTDSGDPFLYANATTAETTTSDDRIKVTSTGFETCPSSVGDSEINNGSSSEFIFLAIRRPDPLVQKPVKDATKVFALATGTGNATANFASGFPVDYLFTRDITGTGDMYSAARLTGKDYNITSSEAAAASSNAFVFDSNVGSCGSGLNSSFQAWQFKRHAGFDVVTYNGNSVVGRNIPHSLSKIPEMIWLKSNGVTEWMVFHKGADASNPSHKYLRLHTSDAVVDTNVPWNDTEPTATHFTVGSHAFVNQSNLRYSAMLFASTAVSKVGSYTGTGNTTGPVISTGFTPRVILFKNASSSAKGWRMLDTLRGLGTSSQKGIRLNESAAQDATGGNYVTTTSTSFQPILSTSEFNESGSTILYYAHA